MHIHTELHGLWCGRLTVWGTRVVTCVDKDHLNQYMRSHGIVGVDDKTFFKDLKSDGLNALVKEVKVYWATVGPGAYLWMPHNFLVMEKVHAEDTFGLRAPMILPRDAGPWRKLKALSDAPATPEGHFSKLICDCWEGASYFS